MIWLWYGCLLLSAGCLILAVKNLLVSSEGTFVKILKVVVYLACAAFLLYVPVYFLQNNFFTALTANLINVMQVISLDADYLDKAPFIAEHIGSGAGYRLYMAVLGLVHFSMPLLSILALYSVLFRFYSHIQLLNVNLFGDVPVYVFNELNEKTVRMAKDIQKNRKKGKFIFAGFSEREKNKEAEDLSNVIRHPDQINNIRLKHKAGRDIYYFFLSEDENTNMNEALDLITFLADKDKAVQKSTHMYIGAHSIEAESMLDSSRKQEIDVNILKTEEAAVYRLLDEYPLYENAEKFVIAVLMIGLDAMGIAFVKAAAWCGQILGYRLKIRVAGIGIGTQISDFKFRYPGLSDCSCLDLEFYDCAGYGELFDVIRTKCADTTYAVVAQGSDMEVTETALQLRREFYRKDRIYSFKPQIFAYVRNPDQAQVLGHMKTSEIKPEKRVSYDIIPFGNDDEIYSYKNILDSDYECLSRNVHLVYTDISRSLYESDKPDIDVPKALTEYNLLEVNKRSNRANAMHIRYRLALLGLDYVRETEAGEEEADYFAALTDEKLEELTRVEHDRWLVFLLSEGWITADLSDVDAYQASGISAGRHNCPLMKMHPFICPFEELPSRSEHLHQGDSTIYDRELIRRMPDILHDRWNVSGVRYKIVPRKTGV